MSLVGTAAAAVTFAATGNFQFASIAYSIGSGVEGYLNAPDTQGPRLDDRSVQVSSLGVPLPEVFGTWRCRGNIIWPLNFEVDEHSQSESAKGGGPEHTSWTYTGTFAVLLCRGPKEGIGRVWANKKLIVDENGNRDPCISVMRFMLGGEDQEPDALMVARDGHAPAYRDSVLIVFEDLELTQSGFGNRPPLIEAEVFSNSETSGPPDPRFEDGGEAAPVALSAPAIALVDPETGYIWSTSQTGEFGSSVETAVSDDESQTQLTTFSTALASSSVVDMIYVPDGDPLTEASEVWVIAHVAVGKTQAVIYNADTQTYIETVDLGSFGTATPFSAIYNEDSGKVLVFTKNGLIIVVDPATRTVDSSFSAGALGAVFPYEVVMTTDYIALFYYGGSNVLQLRNRSDYTLHQQITVGGSTSKIAYDSDRERLIVATLGGMAYQTVDIATGTVTGYTLAAAADADANPSTAIQSVIYYDGKYIFGATATAGESSTLYLVNPDSFVTEHTWTYEAYVDSSTPMMVPTLLAPLGDPNYILSFDRTHIKRLYIGSVTVGGPVTLASIVSALCTNDPFGMEASDIDVTELTDLVDGYFVGEQVTRRAAIQALQPAFRFDGVESDHVLKFVMRGQAPVVTIAKAKRGAHEGGASGPPDLSITRGAELELPWRLDVNYMDAARDYQISNQYDSRTTRNANAPVTLNLPVLMPAADAKATAIINLYLPWVNRTKFKFQTDNTYAKYEPTDVVTLTTDDVTYIARITSRSDQGNGVIDWEAELEDIAIYDQEGVVAASGFVPQTIIDPGETILHLLDTPILRDVDDNAGFYVAMGGTTDGWRGAQLFKSSDNGSTYQSMLAITNESTIGAAQSVLGDFTAGNIFDEGNSVTVRITAGAAPASATETQVLNGSNTAVIGAPGRWEVINFKNAALIAEDTYQLSGFLRGRRGTEWATGTHVAGDTFILASPSAWQRPNAGSAEIGLPRLYKAPPFRTTLASADAESFTNTAVGLEPYSPVDLAATRDGSGNITITCRRRARYGYGTLNATVPIEPGETYSLDIRDGAAVARTLAGSEADGVVTFTYSAADQTTDFGGLQDPVAVRGFIVSATVGRGTQAEATV